MQNHGDRHNQRDNVHGAGSSLEDDGIGHLNVTREAVWLDSHARRDRGYRPYGRAER